MRKFFRAKVLFAGFAGLMALAGAFAAGIAVAPRFWVLRDSLQRSHVGINVCPPPEGDLYEVDDFLRANNAAEAFLAQSDLGSCYGHLDLRYFATPEPGGYTLYHSTGNPKATFPPELLLKVEEVFKEALNGGR